MSERYTIFPAINPPWTGKGRGGIVIRSYHPSSPPTHTHTPALPLWVKYCRSDTTCTLNQYVYLESLSSAHVVPGMMIKDPCGSMATKHTLRMLGVSEAEMPHIRHMSFRRRLSDCRFLLFNRMLQSGTQRRDKGETE